MLPAHRMNALLLLSLVAAWGCSETLDVPPRPVASTDVATSAGSSCGASYTMIISEEDSLMATYDIPATQDTVSVCETWTGTDYTLNAKVLGSSEFVVSVRDTVQQVAYASGTISAFDVSGTSLGAASGVGGTGQDAGTAFGFMNADSSTRQASYDAPYYAVTAAPLGVSISPSLAPPATAPDTATKYTRHKLSRRGVRALVDGMEEVARGNDGRRRFRRVRTDGEDIVGVDPATELIVSEESNDADGSRVVASHNWERTASGWVRTRTDLDVIDASNGAVYPSHSTIRYRDVRVDAVLQTPAAPARR